MFSAPLVCQRLQGGDKERFAHIRHLGWLCKANNCSTRRGGAHKVGGFSSAFVGWGWGGACSLMSTPVLGAGKGFSKWCSGTPDSGRDNKSGFSESAQLGIMSELHRESLQRGPGALGSSPSVMAAFGTRHNDALVTRTLFLHIPVPLCGSPHMSVRPLVESRSQDSARPARKVEEASLPCLWSRWDGC